MVQLKGNVALTFLLLTCLSNAHYYKLATLQWMLTCVLSLKYSNRCSQKFTWQFTHKSYITQTVLTKTILLKTIIKTITQRVSANLRTFNNYAMLKLKEYHSTTFINKIYLGFFIVEDSLCIDDLIHSTKAIGFKWWKAKLVIFYACAKSCFILQNILEHAIFVFLLFLLYSWLVSA